MELTGQTKLASEKRVIKGFLAAGLLLGLLTISLVLPADLPLPACAFRAITGHSCLTCGLTRSMHAFSHGELGASLRYHMLGPIVFLGMLLAFMVFAMEAIIGRRFPVQSSLKLKSRFVAPFAIIWLVYWGTRLITEYMTT
jgi:hypothetical protein